MGVFHALRISDIFELRVAKNGHYSFIHLKSVYKQLLCIRCCAHQWPTEISKVQSLFLKTLESRGRNQSVSKRNRNINKNQR